MFTGLSAFPLTPFLDDEVNTEAVTGLVKRLSKSNVDSISILGSTGSFAYLTQEERNLVTRIAVKHAQDKPVFVGVGALRTSQVLENISRAKEAGASAAILTPMTYHPLNDTEVFSLFRAAAEHSDLPMIVYENPQTTRFTFTLDLYRRIGELPNIASLKLPALPENVSRARDTIAAIRKVIPEHITLGISGDASAVTGLRVGCDTWYSVIGGVLPHLAINLTRLAKQHQWTHAVNESERLEPLWSLFKETGSSIRVVAALAEQLGLIPGASLPRPLQDLPWSQELRVKELVELLDLRE